MKNYYDIIIVGGGPAGSMAARFAAEQGVSVLILEKNKVIGYPAKCGEAVSEAGISEFIDIDKKWISTEIDKFSFTAPDKTEVTFPLEGKGYVLDRALFDPALSESAVSAGTEIFKNANVCALLFENDKVCGVKVDVDGEKREIKSKIVIGADGVKSRIGKWAGIKTAISLSDMESGLQITVANIPVEQDTLYFYFGKDIAPEGYFWIFPKGNNVANIGLGISLLATKKKSVRSYLNKFMEENYPDAPVLRQIASAIPCSPTLEQIVTDGLMLVGDAARQVNPLSGGGIATGMIGGSIAGRIAGEAIKQNNLSHIYTYEKDWNERLGKRHKIFDNIKNGIYHFTDDKFNSIAKSIIKVPFDKRSLGKVFQVALVNNPSLLLDIAKVFVVK